MLCNVILVDKTLVRTFTTLIIGCLLVSAGYLSIQIYQAYFQTAHKSGSDNADKSLHSDELTEIETTPAQSIYTWIDDKGKRHFGDMPPESYTASAVAVKISPVETTKFEDVKKAQKHYASQSTYQNQQRSSGSERKQRCKNLKAQVKRDEKNRKHNRHSYHHRREQRLKENRWEIIKNCQ